MSFTRWLSHQLGLSRRAASRRKTHAVRPAFRPTLEALEERWVPSTLKVTNTLDSGAGSLRAEIAAANKNDTIIFAPKLDGQIITLTSGELLISKNLTITGPGPGELTISGNHNSRVFEVAKKTTVSLSGLTISNGDGVFAAGTSKSTDGSGGGILVDAGAALTVNNSTLSGNTASYSGGGICNGVASILTVSNSTLSGNQGDDGGAIFNTTGAVTVVSCTLSSNSATSNDGGGIFNTTGTVTVTDSALSVNTAGGAGGGIFSQGVLTVSRSTLSSNSAHGSGGGIFSGGTGTAMVSDSTLIGNSAYAGGALQVQGGTLTVSNSTLSGNSAVYQGGGIYINLYGAVIVKNSSNITGNTTPYFGTGADIDNHGVLDQDMNSIIGILNGNPAVPI